VKKRLFFMWADKIISPILERVSFIERLDLKDY